ncbi:DMT family transporter [Sporolactobacillus shoreicorticis]|uniref:DMT family transporter n=1 Tax=Sporolactobacillus shoreicorticis TaxID=1923877 RepID=A0ABW5S0G6_9BACL|nr:DMT family transporter [Sporolactobacillus shoreicorticis]MCO7127610.1 DMT family transporter [Sporolactobacillus shoreicorticis]
MIFFILFLSIFGGVLLSTQSSINGAFSRHAGTFESAFLTFFTGMLIMFIVVLFFGSGHLLEIVNVPKWQLSGVWFGVGYLFLTIAAVPKIGVTATNIATVIGQLLMSLFIDHFGWFNGTQVPMNLKRMIAVVLMLIALHPIYAGTNKTEQVAGIDTGMNRQ